MKAINTKEQQKKQRQNLDKALDAETTQGAALRRLKELAERYEFFELSTVQEFIIDQQDKGGFHSVKHTYTKGQQKKVKQLNLIKKQSKGEDVELLTNTTFNIYKVYNDETKVHQKTVGSEEKATESIATWAELGEDPESYEVQKNVTPISTKFTPNEMFDRLQYIERKFWEQYPEAETVTIAMINNAIGKINTKEDRESSKENKAKVDNKAA